jgi:hypothetical protein
LSTRIILRRDKRSGRQCRNFPPDKYRINKRTTSTGPQVAVADREEIFSPETEAKAMKLHQGIKPALWGAAGGAVAISVIGFSAMGWMLGSTAERLAVSRAESAVVAVLSPICVEKFQQQSNAAAKLTEFKKAASWDQRSLIEKGGWAATPGTDKTDSAVISACAEKLGRLS